MPASKIDSISYVIQPDDTLWLIAQRFHTTIYAIADLNPQLNMNSLSHGQVIRICPEYCCGASACPSCCVSITAAELYKSFRMLWGQYMGWMHTAITGILFDLPTTDLVTKRLMQVPVDFAEALKPFYGPKCAGFFTDLIKQYLTIVLYIVEMLHMGNEDTMVKPEEEGCEVANEIAFFLAGINPYWITDEWDNMFREFLQLCLRVTKDYMVKNYSGGIMAIEQMDQQARLMADKMSSGIVKQFRY